MKLHDDHAFTKGFLRFFTLCFPDYGKGKFESGAGAFGGYQTVSNNHVVFGICATVLFKLIFQEWITCCRGF